MKQHPWQVAQMASPAAKSPSCVLALISSQSLILPYIPVTVLGGTFNGVEQHKVDKNTLKADSGLLADSFVVVSSGGRINA
jgi:hypothetical protein